MIKRSTDQHWGVTPASASLEAARRIHEVCRRFEADWRQLHPVANKPAHGSADEEALAALPRPQLPTYLTGVAEPQRSELLAELLAIDLELRATLVGQQPTPADYVDLFPDDASLITEVFRQHQGQSDRQQIPAEAEGASEPGRPIIEGYEILDVIGRGGMGVVYKARDLRLKRLVAVKMVLAGRHASAEHLTRFRAEAETVARLQHPGIVQIYDIGQQDGHPYLTFELIEGRTLAQFANREPQPPRLAADLVEQMAAAIHYAHQQGIVHRDLKPANVLLAGEIIQTGSTVLAPAGDDDSTIRNAAKVNAPPTPPPVSSPESSSRSGSSRRSLSSIGSVLSGRRETNSGLVPKITDFGLAKDLDAEAEYTSTGTVLGTAHYMSPEQATGRVRDVGSASDIYSLGAILYTLLTGRAPVQGTTPIETLKMVVESEPIAPSELQPGLPKDLETICLKCLRKQPAQRYADAEQLAEDLRRFRQGKPIVARPVGQIERAVKWVRRRPAIAALLLVALLGVGGIVAQSIEAGRQKAVAEQRQRDAVAQKTIAQDRAEEALREAAKAKKARDFLVSIFQLSDPDRPGEAVTAIQIVKDAEKRIPKEFADEPELQAELLAAIQEIGERIESKLIVAMILEIRGDVQLHSTKHTNQQPAPNMLLYFDDRLSLAADARVQLVFLSDLHKEWLQGAGEVTVRPDGSLPREAVVERDENILMTFVRLPKGTFFMGWDERHRGVKTEILEDFEIAAHEVTQSQWQAVMGSTPSEFSRFGGKRHLVKDVSDEELKLFPVETVTRNEVMNFIEKLNEREQGRGWLYRLPTEVEWEYACRGGATSEEECSYHFYFDQPTNVLSSDQANFNGLHPFGGAPKGVFLERPMRVGAYPPNKLGLYDMHGNIWEWCFDLEPSNTFIGVLRGSSWLQAGHALFASHRHLQARSERHDHHGFRLVRVPTDPLGESESKTATAVSNGPKEAVAATQFVSDVEHKPVAVSLVGKREQRQTELLAAKQEIGDGIGSNLMVAMILELRGDVQLHSDKHTNQQAAASMLLYCGDRLNLSADAQAKLVFLSDLHKESVQGVGEVTVRRDGSQPREAVVERDEDIWMTFVPLPKGTFYMGWNGKQQKGVKTEIPEDFEIAAHVVTQSQWEAVMGTTPSRFSRFGLKRHLVKDISDEELKLFPVEMVSRDDVMEFIKKLNEREQGGGWLYRLPTTAEWEYACRGGATTEEECSYHFYFDQPTNSLSSAEANIKGNYPYGGAPQGVTLGRPSRVGAYAPNRLGLYDMHGNVFQWCSDLEQGDVIGHLRGGSYRQAAHVCVAGLPHPLSRTARYDSGGFRLVRVPAN